MSYIHSTDLFLCQDLLKNITTMALFQIAYSKTTLHEGGYIFDPMDLGGETYKGIARNRNSKWTGWIIIDSSKKRPNFPKNLDDNQELQELIATLYQVQYWDKLNGDALENQEVANCIFDFGVNAGTITAISMAQLVVDAQVDGVLGPDTLLAINTMNKDHFIAAFTLAKIARYIHICQKRTQNKKYFFGWVIRAMSPYA